MPSNGKKALETLGDKLPLASYLNQKSISELTKILMSDSSFWLDECGYGFYVEEVAKKVENAPDVQAALFDYSQTFKLHSKPGSKRTIYLDFTGHTYSNTAWNRYFRVGSNYFARGYSIDSNFDAFSDSEMDVIQSIWQRVSEDYAPFDVDVTTEEPAIDLITRSSISDVIYGTRAVVTSDTGMQRVCSCGGVAYVGVFDESASHAYYQPAWIFTAGVGTGAKNITEALSHEVGHNLGLSHDGTTSVGYYQGRDGWAPIMGVGYYQGLTQWSKGEYLNANNREDDFALISSNGATVRQDDFGDSAASAQILSTSISGIITSDADVDWFSFTPSQSANATISAEVAPTSPNLDIKLNLYESSNTNSPIQVSDPSMSIVDGDKIGGLSASINRNLSAGVTYYVSIEGVGYTNSSEIYTGYGSVGNYKIQISGIAQALAITTTSLPDAMVGSSYSAQLSGVGGVGTYIWTKQSGPSWINVSPDGTVTGDPIFASQPEKLFVMLTDANSSANKELSINVKLAPLSITTPSLPSGFVNRNYSASISANGGLKPYTWALVTRPSWLIINSDTGALSGTPTKKGNYSVTVRVTDSAANTTTQSYTIRIN